MAKWVISEDRVPTRAEVKQLAKAVRELGYEVPA